MGLFSNQVKPAAAAEKEAPPKPKSKWDLDDDGNVSFQEAATILKDTANEVMNSEKYGTCHEGAANITGMLSAAQCTPVRFVEDAQEKGRFEGVRIAMVRH